MKQRVSSPTMAAWLVSGATALCGTAAHAVTAAPKPEITARAANAALIKAAPKPIKTRGKHSAGTEAGCITIWFRNVLPSGDTLQ